jgi:hypothetical protein
MQRPQSIIWFERLYLSGIAVAMLNVAVNWKSLQSEFSATSNSGIGNISTMIGLFAFSLLITLAFWYYAARKRSNVSRWVITVFFALSLLSLPASLAGISEGLISPLMALLENASSILTGISVWMLFRKDSKVWFDRQKPDLRETFK